jgi:alpha-mannosidase
MSENGFTSKSLTDQPAKPPATQPSHPAPASKKLGPPDRVTQAFGKSPFAQLAPARVRAALGRLRSMIFPDMRRLDVHTTQASPAHITLAQASQSPLTLATPGQTWGMLFDQRWCKIAIPSAVADKPYHLHWHDQGQATLYVQAEPYYGFDVMHRSCPLPAGVTHVWIDSYCCQTALIVPELPGLTSRGSLFEGAFISTRDDQAFSAVHDLQCLHDLAVHLHADDLGGNSVTTAAYQPALERVSPIYRQLLRALDVAIDTLETAGLAALRVELASIYRDFSHAAPRIRARLIGNSHLDLVYLWPESMGQAKAVHTFSTVNRLLNLYPEFKFTYSQPASYEAVQERAPGLAKAIDAHIQTGRWEPTGAMYVESDTMLPCGEALARSFILGQACFTQLTGSPAKLLWLPDAFGFAACIPQIMKLTGVDYFFTTKLSWNTINTFPYSSFVWRGSDGSQVIAHAPRAGGYANTVDVPALNNCADTHTQSDVHREYMHPVGYGDGGGGPTEEMCERARRFANLAGVPPTQWDQPQAFFHRLAALESELPVWQGECYVEFHRGVSTTHGHVKATFRALERTLQTREAAAVALGINPDLTDPWKRLIFSQFHDYVTGTSVPEVYAQGVPELQTIIDDQLTATRDALSGSPASQASSGTQTCVFNPLPVTWSGWIDRAGQEPRYLQIKPLQSVSLAQASPQTTPQPATVRGSVMSNGIVRAVITPQGAIASLEVAGRELELTPGAGIPVIYPDFPAKYDAWDIDRHTLALGQPVDAPHRIEVQQAQGTRAVVAVHRHIGQASELVVRFILDSGASVLRIQVDVDWHEPQMLLKLPFTTTYRGHMARFGAPFGSVLRPQQPGPSFAEARWETPMSRWAAVSHDGERDGLFIVSQAKYGVSCRDGQLSLSLLRSPVQTGFQAHGPATPRALSRHVSPSKFTDQGRHNIQLAVGRYDAGCALENHPATLADTLFTQPVEYQGQPIGFDLACINNSPSLVPAWVIPADNSRYTLRLHEVSGQAGTGTLTLPKGHIAQLVDMRSLPTPGRGPLTSGDKNRYRPYEILSLQVQKA